MSSDSRDAKVAFSGDGAPLYSDEGIHGELPAVLEPDPSDGVSGPFPELISADATAENDSKWLLCGFRNLR